MFSVALFCGFNAFGHLLQAEPSPSGGAITFNDLAKFLRNILFLFDFLVARWWHSTEVKHERHTEARQEVAGSEA